jgi:hypothetical protein
VNGPGTFMERVIDRAIKALNLVVQSGVCTLVVLDLIDLPATALRRLPAASTRKCQRSGGPSPPWRRESLPARPSPGCRSARRRSQRAQPGGEPLPRQPRSPSLVRRPAPLRSRR